MKSTTYQSVYYGQKAMTAMATITGLIIGYIMMGIFDAFGNAVAIKYIFTDGIISMLEPQGKASYALYVFAQIVSFVFSIFVSSAMSYVIMVLYLQKASEKEERLMKADDDYVPRSQRRAKELSIVTGILSAFAFLMLLFAKYPNMSIEEFFFGAGAPFRWFFVLLCLSIAYFTPRAYASLAEQMREKHGAKIYASSDTYDNLVGDVILAKARAISALEMPKSKKEQMEEEKRKMEELIKSLNV